MEACNATARISYRNSVLVSVGLSVRLSDTTRYQIMLRWNRDFGFTTQWFLV